MPLLSYVFFFNSRIYKHNPSKCLMISIYKHNHDKCLLITTIIIIFHIYTKKIKRKKNNHIMLNFCKYWLVVHVFNDIMNNLEEWCYNHKLFYNNFTKCWCDQPFIGFRLGPQLIWHFHLPIITHHISSL